MELTQVVVMVGFPGVGKTKWVRDNFGGRDDVFHHSSDGVIEEIMKHFELEDWHVWEKLARPLAKHIVDYDLEREAGDYSVLIYDRWNLSAYSRAHILKRLPKTVKKTAVYITTPRYEIWQERRSKLKLSASMYEKLQKMFVPPSPREGFDEVLVIEDGQPPVYMI